MGKHHIPKLESVTHSSEVEDVLSSLVQFCLEPQRFGSKQAMLFHDWIMASNWIRQFFYMIKLSANLSPWALGSQMLTMNCWVFQAVFHELRSQMALDATPRSKTPESHTDLILAMVFHFCVTSDVTGFVQTVQTLHVPSSIIFP